jgi:hypothetical protein
LNSLRNLGAFMGADKIMKLKKQDAGPLSGSFSPAAGRQSWRGAVTALGLLSCSMMMSTNAYAAPPANSSGVKGRVTLSPTCGGPPREGEDCQAPYAQVEIRLLDEAGSVAGQTRTSPQGQFHIAAAAGRYRLQVMTLEKITRCPLVHVLISANTVASVDLDCDSGMR